MNDWKQTAVPAIPENSPDPDSVAPAREEPAGTEPLEDWRKVRELALRQLDRFMSYEPKVLRGDDPDAIHDIRVASRRLQQVLDLVYPQPRPREIRRLRRRIQRCRQALGEVRNCDVLLARVEESLKRKRSSRREAWTAVQHYLLARRSESFLKAMRKLSKVNLAIFYVRLKECLAALATAPGHPTHAAAVADLPVLEPFPERIGQALEGVWNAFEEQVALSQRDPRAPVIHGVRIAAKRLRYLLEVVHAFDIPGSADALAWLRQLQQHLGDWHDLEVLEQMIIEMLARPDFLRERLPLAINVEKLILRNREAKKEFEGKYFRMAEESAEGRRLKDWVNYLVASPSTAFAKG
jgi:CHAD domain-containing protein